jgi:thiamine-phosphate pyrophosphorylase
MPLDPTGRFPVMCLTQDGSALTHSEQAERLCQAGARWVQLRMKDAEPARWLEEARKAAGVCHSHGAILIVNDSVEIALACGADGVHLGNRDGDWQDARGRLGARAIVGASVTNADAARRAISAGCLDYVGLGPLRFTSTKRELSPVLGFDGVRGLLSLLGEIPAWVIGGVVAADLPQLRRDGAAGVAVTAALYRDGMIEENLRELIGAWAAGAPRTLERAFLP